MLLTSMYRAMTVEEIKNHPKYEEAVLVVESLNRYGTDKNVYEYGLPMYSDHITIMAGIVIDAMYTNL